ncbi:hypothetical protein DSL72_005388 [Monilinia vaccinii-corymbosi]|uniref:Phosphoglycerate mutase family protein n=1 Tax=Monilinia vaccinii-corymbosi TaxID=61207 RepID=A0A8A3PFK7_9HELO|nr:hypothetical protein DSL72_005388 [Monilinia vaccinii-corymbosi]
MSLKLSKPRGLVELYKEMAVRDRIKSYLVPQVPEIETRIFVHLMRHGEAYHNLGHFHDRTNKQSFAIPDPSLTKEGIKQVKAAKGQMSKRCPAPNIVLISPLTRTIETALHVFPIDNNRSKSHQPQIVAYDDLRESGAYLCNVRQDVTALVDSHNNEGINFSALSPVIPPMKCIIGAQKRAELVRKEILSIAEIVRQGGGIWNGVYLQGPLKTAWLPLRRNARKDIHIVMVSHGSFLKYLLPASHRINPAWKKFKASEIRTYIMDADGHLNETAESKGTRSINISRKVSSILTSASGSSPLPGIQRLG